MRPSGGWRSTTNSSRGAWPGSGRCSNGASTSLSHQGWVRARAPSPSDGHGSARTVSGTCTAAGCRGSFSSTRAATRSAGDWTSSEVRLRRAAGARNWPELWTACLCSQVPRWRRRLRRSPACGDRIPARRSIPMASLPLRRRRRRNKGALSADDLRFERGMRSANRPSPRRPPSRHPGHTSLSTGRHVRVLGLRRTTRATSTPTGWSG